VLPDGTAVTAVSFLGDTPYDRDRPPVFGLYLDERWDPPWPHEQVDWPDFGLPPDTARLRGALVDLLDRARAGDPVELGCLGGHGRTGTALACLAVLTGAPAGDAVDWVRAHYCSKAVETDGQREFVEAFQG
jgi:protein-tyrosine phosphatase